MRLHVVLIPAFLGVAIEPAASQIAPRPIQRPTPSEMNQMGFEKEESVAEVRRIQDRFAGCVVKRHPREALRLISAIDDDSDVHKRNVRTLSDPECLFKAMPKAGGAAIRFPAGHSFRYVVAYALVRRDFRSFTLSDVNVIGPLQHETYRPPEKLAAPPPGAIILDATEDDKLIQRDKQWKATVYLSHLGECIVRANAAGSHALLMAEPASQREKGLFAPLAKAISTCVPAGEQIELSKTMVRGTIAYNYYRLANAPRLPEAPQ